MTIAPYGYAQFFAIIIFVFVAFAIIMVLLWLIYRQWDRSQLATWGKGMRVKTHPDVVQLCWKLPEDSSYAPVPPLATPFAGAHFILLLSIGAYIAYFPFINIPGHDKWRHAQSIWGTVGLTCMFALGSIIDLLIVMAFLGTFLPSLPALLVLDRHKLTFRPAFRARPSIDPAYVLGRLFPRRYALNRASMAASVMKACEDKTRLVLPFPEKEIDIVEGMSEEDRALLLKTLREWIDNGGKWAA